MYSETDNVRITQSRVRVTILAVGKYCKFRVLYVSVALFNQHEERMHRIILSSMTCTAVPHYSLYLVNRHDFIKKVTENKMCFVFLYNFCLKHFSLSEEFSEMLS